MAPQSQADKLGNLLKWCQIQTRGYEKYGVNVKNFTTSFKNGMAFCAMIHNYGPDLINMEELNPDDVFYNNHLAFTVGFTHFNIPQYLEAEDMVAMRVPDRLCIITYISGMYKELAKREKQTAKTPIKKTPSDEVKSNISNKPVRPTASTESNCSRCRHCSKSVEFLIERAFSNGVLYHRRCLSQKNRENLTFVGTKTSSDPVSATKPIVSTSIVTSSTSNVTSHRKPDVIIDQNSKKFDSKADHNSRKPDILKEQDFRKPSANIADSKSKVLTSTIHHRINNTSQSKPNDNLQHGLKHDSKPTPSASEEGKFQPISPNNRTGSVVSPEGLKIFKPLNRVENREQQPTIIQKFPTTVGNTTGPTIIGQPPKTNFGSNNGVWKPVRPKEKIMKDPPINSVSTENSLSPNGKEKTVDKPPDRKPTIIGHCVMKPVIPRNNVCQECGKIISRPFEEIKENEKFYHQRCLNKKRKNLASQPEQVIEVEKVPKSPINNNKQEILPPKPLRPPNPPNLKLHNRPMESYENNPVKPPRGIPDVVDSNQKKTINTEKLNESDKKLLEIKNQLDKLEVKGRRIEELYRIEETKPSGNPDGILPEFLSVITEKNELVRLEEDIIYKRRNEELEKEQKALLEKYYKLKEKLGEGNYSKSLKELEERIVKIVEERNRVVQNVEEARKRILEEDEYVQTMLDLKFKGVGGQERYIS
ncbi:DgyrCDS1295 [Dimorphilus gyrociliatus]|uniref:DgyrCDS1295 n=1 Tax=Dimorphilus gyrociliatus TaxID=2664684 RepID=A0A7I8V745_9ANNE|nr:DgyrCDS1295 [Dimorphilus gyrociliatus]